MADKIQMTRGGAYYINEVNKIQSIRGKVISEMEDKLNERYLYTIPYDEFYLSTPDKGNGQEVGLRLSNVYVVAKQIEDQKGKIIRQFQIYNSRLNKIAETAPDGRLIYDDNERFDREITEEIIKLKNLLDQKNNENGTNMKIAGLDEDEQLRVYMELAGKKLVSLTEKQRERLHKFDAKHQESEKEKSQSNEAQNPQEIENKENEKVDVANKEKEQQIDNIADDIGIDPDEIWQITPIREDLFYMNNNLQVHSNAFAVVTRDKEVLIVSQKNGKFEKTLDKSTDETGRTSVITSDSKKIEEKNTYGVVYSNVNPNLRYAITYGQFGEIKLIEERKITQNESGKVLSSYEMWNPAREVYTDNTDLEVADEINRKGTGSDSITRNMFNPNKNVRMNEENAIIMNKKGQTVTSKDVSDNVEVRANSALEKVKNELVNRGLNLSSEQEKEIKEEFIKEEISLSDEEAKEYCDKLEIKLRNEMEEKKKNKDESNAREERTLAGDALIRREIMMKRASKQNNNIA